MKERMDLMTLPVAILDQAASFNHRAFFWRVCWMASVQALEGVDANMWLGKVWEGEGMCRPAASLPKVKKSTDGNVARNRELCRSSTCKVLDHLMRNPGAAPDLWGHIQMDMEKAKPLVRTSRTRHCPSVMLMVT